MEKKKCKILWTFAIQTDTDIKHRRPTDVVIDKFIVIAVPRHDDINTKVLEKITRTWDGTWRGYGTLKLLLPVVIRAPGTISDNLEKHLRTIEIPISISCLQETELLGAAFILRTVIGIRK